MLAGAAVVVVLMLVWGLVLHPMANRKAALQARINSQETTLQQLAEARHLLARLATAERDPQVTGNRSLASVVEQGLRMAGLAAAIRRIEPVGEDKVSVVLEQAAFDPLIGWLQEASAGAGITVHELSLDAASNVGAVNARVLLVTGP